MIEAMWLAIEFCFIVTQVAIYAGVDIAISFLLSFAMYMRGARLI